MQILDITEVHIVSFFSAKQIYEMFVEEKQRLNGSRALWQASPTKTSSSVPSPCPLLALPDDFKFKNGLTIYQKVKWGRARDKVGIGNGDKRASLIWSY